MGSRGVRLVQCWEAVETKSTRHCVLTACPQCSPHALRTAVFKAATEHFARIDPLTPALVQNKRRSQGSIRTMTSDSNARQGRSSCVRKRRREQGLPDDDTYEICGLKIGIIGSGGVARTLAAGFLDLDHEVMLGTRDVTQLAAFAAKYPRSAPWARPRWYSPSLPAVRLLCLSRATTRRPGRRWHRS
jgi:hypothetical protein